MAILDIKVSGQYDSGGTMANLAFETGLVDFRTLIPAGNQSINIGTLNPSSSTFPDINSGISYYYNDFATYILGQVNSLGLGTYTLGSMINYDQKISESFDVKQPLSVNLDEFAEIELAPAVKAMLQSPDMSSLASTLADPVATAMELNTAAFEPASAFALSTTTVNGHALSSNVTVTKGDVGLSNVDNTSDLNKPISTATQTALNAKAATSSLATVATTGAYSDLTGKPTIPGAPTTNNNVSRSLNSSYTISSNARGVLCSYSINASWTLNALLSGSGNAFLEYSIDSGSTWITVNNVGKGLNLLTVAGNDDMNLSGFIPSAATNTRIRTTATNMTISYTRGQEVLF